jgi:hypothetical protein
MAMGKKFGIIIILLLVVMVLANSGCIENTKANSTWGEKKISMDAIKVSNNTVGNHSEQDKSVYYVSGYITNQNPIEAINVKLKVTTYYSNGTVFAVNNTPYLEPKNIPANGQSYFYVLFTDPDNKIVRFNVDIVNANGEY